MLDKLIATGAINLPWPTLLNGKVAGTPHWSESLICKKRCGAGSRACAGATEDGEHTCPHGMNYFVASLDGESIFVIYGVRGEKNHAAVKKEIKDALKGRSLTYSKIQAWLASLNSLRSEIDVIFLGRQREMLDPLHDPIRMAKQVHTIANRLVQENDSRLVHFEEKLKATSSELKSLVKASEFLKDSFDLLTIYFNPAAATFGATKANQLHGLLVKLISIFRIDDDGRTKNSSKIYFDGDCYRNVFVRESFKLVPFALLSNAVKYSSEGPIRIQIIDQRAFVEVAIESSGPAIDDDEKARIFERRFRGRWATRTDKDGRGVGLYLASVIAEAHNFVIRVSSQRTGKFKNDVPMALNRFWFDLPIEK